jgi:hypothetical protein
MASVKGIVRDANGAPLNGALVRVHRLDTGAVLGEATSAPVTVGDTLESAVALRLPMSSDLLDTSQYAHTVTVHGGATVVADATALGGGAMDSSAPDSNIGVSLPSSPLLRVTGRFCIEMNARFTAIGDSVYPRFAGALNGTGLMLALQLINSGGGLVRAMTNNSFATISSAPGSVVAGQQYHIALNCDASNVVRLFVDGVMAASTTMYAPLMPVDPVWFFGAPVSASTATGGYSFIHNVRLTLGDERYPAAGFTPPAAPFTPGAPPVDGTYEVINAYTGESYAVAIAPTGGANPVQNHLIHRVIPT